MATKIMLSYSFYQRPAIYVFTFLVWGALILLDMAWMAYNPDNLWLLHVTHQFLMGKHYYIDFFETNPPMVLYLYALPALFFQSLLKGWWIFNFYVLGLIALSSYLCYRAIASLFSDHPKLQYLSFLAALVAMTLMANFAFGEREHLMVCLTLPYLWRVLLRVRKLPVSRGEALIIGILAGLGFSLKPYFVMVLVLAELYLMACRRHCLSWWRVETIGIGAVFFLYLSSIFIIAPDYFDHVLPLVSRFYFQVYHHFPWQVVLCNMTVVLFISEIGLYLAKPTVFQHHQEIAFFMLIAFGGFYICLAQRTNWYYQLYPTAAYTTLLLFLLAYDYLQMFKRPKWKRFLCMGGILLFFLMPLFTIINNSLVEHKAQHKIETSTLIRFLKSYSHQPIYFFSTSLAHSVYPEAYAGVFSASRFPMQLLLPGLVRQLDRPLQDAKQAKALEQAKQEIIGMIVTDFLKYKPALIVVDTHIESLIFYRKHFDYMRFLSTDPRFAAIMKHYRYLRTIGNSKIYLLQK